MYNKETPVEELICTEEDIVLSATSSVNSIIEMINGYNLTPAQSRVLLMNSEKMYLKAAEIVGEMLKQAEPSLSMVN